SGEHAPAMGRRMRRAQREPARWAGTACYEPYHRVCPDHQYRTDVARGVRAVVTRPPGRNGMSLTGIAGKVALVTGAARGRGTGRATALRLAAEGADVACLDIARRYSDFPDYGVAAADELDEVVREIEARGRRALALRADVSSSEEVTAAVARAHDTLGDIDLVCNVAGGRRCRHGDGAGASVRGGRVGWREMREPEGRPAPA